MPDIQLLIFLILLFLVAMLYSGVGHGGASGYLALMGLFHMTPETMRPTSLMLNLFVSIIAWWQYSRTVSMNRKLLIWLILGSIPAAFIGATITLDGSIYRKILGILLFFAASRLLRIIPGGPIRESQPSFLPAFLFGAGIGFLSGLIGIGGGILLSPLLLIIGWCDIRQTALISALFIFLNSLAGMAGLVYSGLTVDEHMYLFVISAVLGGIAGSYIGSRKLQPATLRGLLGTVLVLAGFKLLLL